MDRDGSSLCLDPGTLCLIMLTCPLAYFDIGISAVSEQKYKKFFKFIYKNFWHSIMLSTFINDE